MQTNIYTYYLFLRMASLTLWTRVWVNSRSWWWTGRRGVLRFMGSQRVGHNWATELNWLSEGYTAKVKLKFWINLVLKITLQTDSVWGNPKLQKFSYCGHSSYRLSLTLAQERYALRSTGNTPHSHLCLITSQPKPHFLRQAFLALISSLAVEASEFLCWKVLGAALSAEWG